MKRVHTVAAAGVGIALAASLAACGGGGSGGSGESADLLAEIEESGVVKIGTSNDEPWSAVKGSEAVGIIPDLLREYFDRKGVTAEIESTAMPFDSLIPAMTSNRIQVMGDAMFVTPEREETVTFTDVLFYNAEGLAVEKGNPLDIHEIGDLCGHTGATYKGTVWVDSLNEASEACADGQKIEVKVYGTIFEAFQDIQTGRVQGVLADASIASLAINRNTDLNMELAEGYEPVDKAESDNALAVMPKYAAFAEDFSEVYAEMKADGTVAQIFADNGLNPPETWLELE